MTFTAIAILLPGPHFVFADDPAAQPTPAAASPARPADLDHQPDTMDQLKSALEAFTEFRTFTCKGQVRNALYNKPIAGAKVIILKLASPQRFREGDAKVLKRLETTTDADGKFSFDLPTDLAFVPDQNVNVSPRMAQSLGRRGGMSPMRRGQPFFPLEIEVKHPDYATCHETKSVYVNYGPLFPTPYGEGFTQVPEPVDPAVRPLGDIGLRPGKEVTGVLQSSDGKPLAGVKVIAYSQVPKNERDLQASTSAGQNVRQLPPPASEDATQTDEQGRFRVTMITPGEGMLELLPTDGNHAMQFEFLYDRRGDLGTIKLARGHSIRGRVLDSNGRPMQGVFLTASPWAMQESKYSGAGVSVFQHPQRIGG